MKTMWYEDLIWKADTIKKEAARSQLLGSGSKFRTEGMPRGCVLAYEPVSKMDLAAEKLFNSSDGQMSFVVDVYFNGEYYPDSLKAGMHFVYKVPVLSTEVGLAFTESGLASEGYDFFLTHYSVNRILTLINWGYSALRVSTKRKKHFYPRYNFGYIGSACGCDVFFESESLYLDYSDDYYDSIVVISGDRPLLHFAVADDRLEEEKWHDWNVSGDNGVLKLDRINFEQVHLEFDAGTGEVLNTEHNFSRIEQGAIFV